jgi:DNA-binding MarR family transcriptional regulator
MTHPTATKNPIRLPAVIPPHLDELSRRIFRVAMVWKEVLDGNITAEGLDGIVPSGAGLVLFALFERDGWTVGELARRAKVSHVAVLHVIQRIEDAGLVKRKSCPDDRRATRVWLTPLGRELEPRMKTLHERNLATLVGILGSQDAIKLGELLERLMAGLSERCAESSGSSCAKR